MKIDCGAPSKLFCICVIGFVATLLLPGCAGKPEEHGAELPKYKAEVHEAGVKPVDRKFDLSKEKDAEELASLIREGKIGVLEKEEAINPLLPVWELGIWTLVVFGLLFFVLSRIAWKPMLAGLQRREHSIHSAIDEARKARAEAEGLRKQWQGEVDKAHEKVRDILDTARRDAQHMTEEMVAKARSEIQGERDRLRREIEMAKDQALQELWNRTAQLATAISFKAIQRQISTEDHRRLVDEALTELGEAGARQQRQAEGVRA